jgi:hypothetical protein
MQQTFPVELEPRVSLTRVSGDLEVKGWDRREISLEWDDHTSDFHQEGNTLMLADCASDVAIRAPYDTEIRVQGLGGEVFAQDIQRVELKDVNSDVELKNIGKDAILEKIGEAILLEDIAGDLQVQDASSLRARRKIGGDATLQNVPLIEIEMVGADLEIHEAEMVVVGHVGGDLEVLSVSQALRCGSVSGDCQISQSADAEISLGNIGGDLEIDGASSVQLGNTGGDCEIREVQQAMHIGNVGGDGTILEVSGDLTVGRIGSDAELRGLGGSIRVGGIGGDLELQAAFKPECRASLHVGGDAEVTLPANANLTVQATVGGSVSGPVISSSSSGNLVRLVYGEGVAHLHLSVGGDLNLSGGGNPQVSSASMPWWEFGQEMAGLGQEMARMGEELGLGFQEMFRDMSWMGSAWADDVSRKVEEQMRKARHKAEQHARKAEERARQAEERARHAQERARQHAGRFSVRVNEREWQMNPDRINDLVNRAQQAAMEGVAGAMEAVERAVNNLRVPRPGWRPTPPPPPTGGPVPPVPPVPPVAPTPPGSFPGMPPVPPVDFPGPPPASTPPSSFSAPAEPVEQPAQENAEAGKEPNLEQEREAILRMIAEGRITPEEGDMLLEGLGG